MVLNKTSVNTPTFENNFGVRAPRVSIAISIDIGWPPSTLLIEILRMHSCSEMASRLEVFDCQQCDPRKVLRSPQKFVDQTIFLLQR